MTYQEIDDSIKVGSSPILKELNKDDFIVVKDPKKVAAGKKSKGQGMRFEIRVRKDLESQGFICDKWTNNLSYPDSNINLPSEERGDFKLHPAKPKFRYDFKTKRMMPIGMSSGFPDFICFKERGRYAEPFESTPEEFSVVKKQVIQKTGILYEIIAVESKMDGKLDKLEKEKCVWYLQNNVFSSIWIAKKGPKRGQIVYEEFK